MANRAQRRAATKRGNGAFNKNFVHGARYCPICGAKMDGDGNA